MEYELAAGDKALKTRAARNGARKPRLPDNLPVGEEMIVDPQEVQAWRQMGEEVTEQLDYTPARFSKRRIIRRKYVKRDQPHQAPLIAALVTLAEGSLAAPGLLAQIIVAKSATICRCIARSRSTGCATASNCPGKVRHAGWGWPRSGWCRCMRASTPG